MKNTILLLISLTLISCDFVKKQSTSKFDTISEKDTTCLNDIKKAKKDIEKGKLVYCHTMGGLLYIGLRSEKELTLLLKKNNIEFTGIVVSDVESQDQTHCYCSFMKETIIEKYGKNFIDSLLTISDQLYVKNITNDTLYYANCDQRPNYPNDKSYNQDEYSDALQMELLNKVTYPKGYIKRRNNNDAAFVDLYFYVSKKGESKITGYWFLFDNKTNHKFEKDIIAQIKKHIQTENWKPAQIRGKNVNSNMVFRYGLN